MAAVGSVDGGSEPPDGWSFVVVISMFLDFGSPFFTTLRRPWC